VPRWRARVQDPVLGLVPAKNNVTFSCPCCGVFKTCGGRCPSRGPHPGEGFKRCLSEPEVFQQAEDHVQAWYPSAAWVLKTPPPLYLCSPPSLAYEEMMAGLVV
jgi:hypothetical protein